MDQLGNGETNADWANDPAGEASGPPLTIEEIREKVRIGIDQLDRGEYVTGE
jgi:hypothetical protein